MRVREGLLLLQNADPSGDIQPNTPWEASFPTVCGRHVHQDREHPVGLHVA